MAFNGTGTTIAFASGFLAQILDINGPALGRIAINTSHMLSATTTSGPYHTYIPGALVEGGELSIQIAYDPGATIPIASAAETVTITWSDTGAATAAFSGFMTAFNIRTPLEGRATADVTIKVAGKITFTP